MTEKVLEGKLLLYSETGMEGGCLSIQDLKFISLDFPSFGVGNNCMVCDRNDSNRQGLTSNEEVFIDNNWFELPDPICKDEDYRISSLCCGEQKGDLNADKRLSEKYNFKIKYSIERLDETYGEGNWEIDGNLPNVILKDGSRLHFGDTPTTVPSRPYGIKQGAKTRVTVKWNDGTVEYRKTSDELLIENWNFKGLHMLKNGDLLRVFAPATRDIICEGQIELIPLIVFSQTKNGHFAKINLADNKYEWEKYFRENYHAELYR
jgi:hypothetical protein